MKSYQAKLNFRNLLFLFAMLPFLSKAQLSEREQFQVDSVQQVIKSAKHDSTRVNSWFLWGSLIRKTDPKKRIQLLSKIEQVCEANLDKGLSEKEKSFYLSSKSKVFNIQGDIQKGKGAFEEALEYYNKSLDLNLERNDSKAIAGSYNNIGIVYGIQANYEECKKYILKSLRIYEDIQDKDGIANAYNNLGVINYYQGNYKPAIDYWTKSLKWKEKIGEKKGMANTLNNIGNIYRDLKDYDKAIDYYSRSLKIYEETKDDQGIAVCSYNMGNIYQEMGKLEEAKKVLERSLEIHEKLGNKRGVADALNGLGSIYKERKGYSKARENFHKSLAIHEEIGVKKGISVSLNNLGIVYMALGRYNYALEFAERSLAVAKEIGSLKRKQEAANTLWKIHKKLGNPTEALEMHELYISCSDSLLSEENRMEIVRQEYEYQYQKQATADSIKSAEAAKVKDAQLAAEQAENKQRRFQQYLLFGGLAIALIFGGFIYNRFRVTTKQKEIIEDQKNIVDEAYHELESKNKEILDSINYAKRIQYAILPPQSRIDKYLPNSFIFYKPKDIVAGDFYWLEYKEGKVLFAACDCTGHGVPGAMVSVVCNNGLNRAVREHGLTDPGKILDKTREIVIEEFEKSEADGESTISDGMDIALVSLEQEQEGEDSVAQNSCSKLKYAGAHNPLWIIRKGGDKVEEIKADKQPIGKFEKSSPYTSHQLELKKGDTLYVFSDGFADQFGGGSAKPSGKKFKTGNFKQFLLSIQDKSMKEQGKELEKTFETWKGDFEQLDDVCVIGVKI